MARLSRLTHPLVRRNGILESATWDEAITATVTGLGAIKTARGGNALGMFSCSKATNETNYLAQKFGRTVLGTNNIDSCNRT